MEVVGDHPSLSGPQKFRREVIAWRHLRHPNILPFIGVNLERRRLAMVSEWMDHGNISEFVKNHGEVNRVQLVSDCIRSLGDRCERVIQLADAANGLEYMHSIRMVHGDLKGVWFLMVAGCPSTHHNNQGNILINQSFRACLADFGLSTIVGMERRAAANGSLISMASKTSLLSFTAGGTTRWMNPELLDPDRFGITDHRPTKQSDCYALGMVVYEVRASAIAPPLHNGLT